MAIADMGDHTVRLPDVVGGSEQLLGGRAVECRAPAPGELEATFAKPRRCSSRRLPQRDVRLDDGERASRQLSHQGRMPPVEHDRERDHRENEDSRDNDAVQRSASFAEPLSDDEPSRPHDADQCGGRRHAHEHPVSEDHPERSPHRASMAEPAPMGRPTRQWRKWRW